MTKDEAITAAAKRLETVEVQFANVEQLFFEHKVPEEVLRSAWVERDEARRALRAAHVGAEGVSMPPAVHGSFPDGQGARVV